jgi:cytochrome c
VGFLALLVWAGIGTAPAGAAEDGRALYAKHCARCHGSIDETRSGALGRGRFLPAVMTPLGPNLTGIYGRRAGTVPGYRYSNAFRKAARGLVWQADSLDRWLANSQAMIRGSYMFFKLERPARSRIIRYLEAYSPYDGTSG